MKYEHGLDPMVHHKRAHFLYDETNQTCDDEKLKIFIFMKFIGEGLLDSAILQLGFIHEQDKRPQFIAIEPDEKLSKRLIDQLKYSKSSRSGTWDYDNQICKSMKKALEDLVDYAKDSLKKERKREAILMAFHSDHVIALINQILIHKMSNEFVGVFRGYTILEEDVRRLKKITRSPHLTLDDAYYELFKKEPSETSSESDSKAKKLRKIFDKIEGTFRVNPRMHPLDGHTFNEAKNRFFKHLEDLVGLAEHLQKSLEKTRIRNYPMEKFFNPFPNHFHKPKNAEHEVVEKRVAWKFCELLVASTLTFEQMLNIGGRKGWSNCFHEFKVIKKIAKPLRLSVMLNVVI